MSAPRTRPIGDHLRDWRRRRRLSQLDLALDAEISQNVLRLSLHPGGLAPMIVNLPEWRDHLLQRLHREIGITGDASLIRLLSELQGFGVACERRECAGESAGFVTPLRLSTPDGALSLISCTTVFGAPVDVTVSELARDVHSGRRRIGRAAPAAGPGRIAPVSRPAPWSSAGRLDRW